MKQKTFRSRQPAPFQLRYEKALAWSLCLLGLFHLLITMGNYVFDTRLAKLALTIDRYAALAVVLASLMYVLITYIRFRGTMCRIQQFLRNAFTGDRLWLTLLFLWYLICILVMGKQQGRSFFRPNDRYLLDVCISFFVLYMIPREKRVYEWGFHILMLVETVFIIWALTHIFRLDVVSVPGGQIGMDKEYGLCIACNPNTTGAFASVFFLMAVYMAVVKKGILRVLYGLAALVQLFPLYLSNSRTAYLASILAFAVFCFFLVWRRDPGKNRILFSSLAGVLGGAAFYFLRFGVLGLFESVTHFSQYLTQIDGTKMEFTSLSGRIPIWRAAVKAIFLSPRYFFFGVTPAAVESMLGYLQNKENYVMYTHNQFLQMGVAFGVPGLVFYCVWLVRTAVKCIRVGLKTEIWVIPVMVLMLVLSNIMESYLVAYYYFCGGVFFLICGWVLSEAEKNPPVRKPHRKKRWKW